MNKKLIIRQLKEKEKYLKEISEHFFGYPNNTEYDYSALFNFLHFSLNNIGDPWDDSSYKMGTRDFEKEVIEFFAGLYELSAGDFWGYVTNGGTEGNMHGLFLGRELYPNSILYFSEDSHYSITKIARILNMQSITVPSNSDGSISIKHLEKLLSEHNDRVPIFNLNMGTTMKGGVDDIDGMLALLSRLTIKDYYIHCDAALYGMILPFLEGAPFVNFTKPIGSVAVSGHKFIGSPIPCGISLTRKKFITSIARSVEYIDTLDTTISGSRNAFTPLVLWHAIKTRGYEGFKEEASKCIENARYLHDQLISIGHTACLNDFSNTVLIDHPSQDLCDKWQLASQGEKSHIVVMQHVTKKKIDQFVHDLEKGVKHS